MWITERVRGKIVICQTWDEYVDSASYTCRMTSLQMHWMFLKFEIPT